MKKRYFVSLKSESFLISAGHYSLKIARQKAVAMKQKDGQNYEVFGVIWSTKELKRCPVCNKWFIDETKNKVKKRCSNHCTWLWWNRSRRKEAGHKRKTDKSEIMKETEC